MTRSTGFLVSTLTCFLVFSGQLAAQIRENLAFEKPATQSSTLGGFHPGLAVDTLRGTFSHTRGQADLPGPAWWQVDLGEARDIGIITLWNRTSCCGSRLRDIVVEILAEDGQTVVYQTTDPSAPDPALLLNPENELGTYPDGPASLTVDLGEEPVEGQFVKVYRIPDEDLSGTGGEGAPDESTVLVLADVEVYSEGCPTEGDTFCELLDAVGPGGADTIGVWTLTVDAVDESDDFPLTYAFTATHEDGTTVSATLTDGTNQTTMNLDRPGTWIVSVTVDDDTQCADINEEATCTEEIFVEPLPGLTDAAGLLLTKAFLVLGPFTHPFACGGPADQLLRNQISNARIACEYPRESDPVDYDPDQAATTGYVGPEPDGVPTWRALDDGSPDNGDLDLSLAHGALDGVMSWVVTYVEYAGQDPVEIEFCLGSDDGGQLWLDDQALANDSTCRGRTDCDVTSESVVIEPGVHRIAAAAWNNTGGWGLRVSMQEANFGPRIVDDGTFSEWRFHGTTPPEGFDPPDPADCASTCEEPTATAAPTSRMRPTGSISCSRGEGGRRFHTRIAPRRIQPAMSSWAARRRCVLDATVTLSM